MGDLTIGLIEILIFVLVLELAVLLVALVSIFKKVHRGKKGPIWTKRKPFDPQEVDGEGNYVSKWVTKDDTDLFGLVDHLACGLADLHAQSRDHYLVNYEQLNTLIRILDKDKKYPVPAHPNERRP